MNKIDWKGDGVRMIVDSVVCQLLNLQTIASVDDVNVCLSGGGVDWVGCSVVTIQRILLRKTFFSTPLLEFRQSLHPPYGQRLE